MPRDIWREPAAMSMRSNDDRPAPDTGAALASQPSAHSQSLYERARRFLPGGTGRTSTFALPHPLYARYGAGCRVVDVDGVSRLDFNGNYTAMIHGHAHPEIVGAIVDQVRHGTSFCLATEHEVTLAQLLCERLPSVEQVRFMCSGTEAVMMAIKAARAYTGRACIAKCEGAFHGQYDHAEVSLDPSPDRWGDPEPIAVATARGTPDGVLRDTVIIPFNDTALARRILLREGHRIAAVLIDPMPNRAGLIPATAEFLEMLQEFCSGSGTLLISDEVINLRLACGGAQEAFGYRADLTVLGKIIGGGLPVGAVGGRADIMQMFDPAAGKPAVSQSGTFAASPAAMVAGAVSLRLLDRDALARLNALGETTRQHLLDAMRLAGLAAQVTGCGSLFRIHFHARALRGYRDSWSTPVERRLLAAFHRHLLDLGVILSAAGMGALSTPMTEDDVGSLLAACELAFRAIASGPESFIGRYE